MASHSRSGTIIGEYTLRQFVGQGESRFLYLAAKTGSQTLYWLLESEMTLAHQAYSVPDSALFEHSQKNYLAFPVKGSSVAGLARLVQALDPAFIGWRWVEFANDIGYLHKNGIVYQRNHAFSLD